jgi:undecaprenyl-diphosphatase
MVDNHILALGVFYVVVALTYILFEVLVINHRPVLIEGVLEASYPSSHTMLSICILGSAIIEIKKLFKNKKKLVITLDAISIVVMVIIVLGRLLSGMHWFTDIIGGILISLALVFIFHGVLKLIEKKINNQSLYNFSLGNSSIKRLEGIYNGSLTLNFSIKE